MRRAFPVGLPAVLHGMSRKNKRAGPQKARADSPEKLWLSRTGHFTHNQRASAIGACRKQSFRSISPLVVLEAHLCTPRMKNSGITSALPTNRRFLTASAFTGYLSHPQTVIVYAHPSRV
jgi:hypothetical protein